MTFVCFYGTFVCDVVNLSEDVVVYGVFARVSLVAVLGAVVVFVLVVHSCASSNTIGFFRSTSNSLGWHMPPASDRLVGDAALRQMD